MHSLINRSVKNRNSMVSVNYNLQFCTSRQLEFYTDYKL